MQKISNSQLAAQLRALADIYEANPDIAQLYDFQVGTELLFCGDQAQFAATVKAFGPGEKRDEKTNYMEGTISFRPTNFPSLQVVAHKAKVCERVVVGTREIPEVRIPETIVPAHTEEIIEYRCRPFLKDSAPVAAAAEVEVF